ncbi:uncharacterized protein METZ01_LOCUS357155, partial [marine metagenome]
MAGCRWPMNCDWCARGSIFSMTRSAIGFWEARRPRSGVWLR